MRVKINQNKKTHSLVYRTVQYVTKYTQPSMICRRWTRVTSIIIIIFNTKLGTDLSVRAVRGWQAVM